MLTRHCGRASVKKFQTCDQPTITKQQKNQNEEIGHTATATNQI